MIFKSCNKLILATLFIFIVALFLSETAVAHLEVNLDYLGLREGDIIGSTDLSDPDIYIINEAGYKRLFVSPAIFNLYGHLRFTNVKKIDDDVLAKMSISALFRNCETNDPKVYALRVVGEDTATLHWVNVSGNQAVTDDPEFFHKIFCINSREFAMYTKSSAYSALSQIPIYKRSGLPSQSINETNLPLKIPASFKISLFTPKIGPLRFMAFSPDGILFVSMPSSKGLYADNRPDDGKIFALPDKDNNGIADEVKTVLSGLHIPHGMAFYDNYFYLAEEGTISRYPYTYGGNIGSRQVIATLPTGGEHVSRTISFSPPSSTEASVGKAGKMYVSVGSTCNNCPTGKEGTATIWEFNADGSGGRIFARGLRNTVGFVVHPITGEIWGTDNGRDFLGDDLPPDEINIIRDNKNYGWPYCYGKKITDPEHNNAAFCPTTEASTYDLQAHSAPLGLRFISGPQFPPEWQDDLLVARHGSWNRSQPVGYDIVRLDVESNTVVGEYPFITGWLTAKNEKLGRPVDVIFDSNGNLYISDDKVNSIYRVTAIQ